MVDAGYETFFGLLERPFSLTSDPKYFFGGHSHGRALELLTFGLRRRDPFLLVTGDLGVGKTTVCRTLVGQLQGGWPVAYLSSPLLSGPEFERVLLERFGVATLDDLQDGATVVLDEAHTTPPPVIEVLGRMSSAAIARGKVMPVVFASQPNEHSLVAMGMQALDRQISTRTRLLPLGREDCAAYVAHRLSVAGASAVMFSSRACDVLFALSGGVPRLVNLLCERALREAAAGQSRRIEPATIEAAASALELVRAQPRRFRWFQPSAYRKAAGVMSRR